MAALGGGTCPRFPGPGIVLEGVPDQFDLIYVAAHPRSRRGPGEQNEGGYRRIRHGRIDRISLLDIGPRHRSSAAYPTKISAVLPAPLGGAVPRADAGLPGVPLAAVHPAGPARRPGADAPLPSGLRRCRRGAAAGDRGRLRQGHAAQLGGVHPAAAGMCGTAGTGHITAEVAGNVYAKLGGGHPLTAPPAPPAPRVYVVDNAGDDLAAVRHINACGGPAEHRAVLRPTPGAGDVLTTGWDLLVAAGKPPHAARREHVSALSWQYGQAWLAGSGVTDLIVDRAHLLTRDPADAAAAASAPQRPVLPCGCCGAPASTRTLRATTPRRTWWPGRGLPPLPAPPRVRPGRPPVLRHRRGRRRLAGHLRRSPRPGVSVRTVSGTALSVQFAEHSLPAGCYTYGPGWR